MQGSPLPREATAAGAQSFDTGQYYAREKKTRRADFSIRYRVQGSPLPKDARNPRWVSHSINSPPHALLLYADGVTPAILIL